MHEGILILDSSYNEGHISMEFSKTQSCLGAQNLDIGLILERAYL
jgi:hypothetical protein